MYSYTEDDYYQDIVTNPSNRILLSGFGNPIYGFIDGETSFQASASYSAELPETAIAETVAGGANAIKKGAASLGLSDINTVASPPTNMTRQVWQSSALNAIAFDLYIPSERYGANVMEMGKIIFDWTLPSQAYAGFVYVPNHYSVDSNGGQRNLISVYVGNWFHAPNAFVVTTASLVVSKERLMGTNDPLYIKISVTLSPGREFRAEEVKAWFL